ncbi:sigma-54 dependent DNA-binding response regulator [Candidatus Thiomargarita nelsonii]|uniref:Sigma-54 dependent DNA-binding response regulator n=1 Tax=Candidatus Thiomargarita nelsonii TaxID=1003181 RepID=A0A176S4T5_9GAMM|nr:sigma-54 dependent DNA-binding response regulator [Candidatus Thiomargarita nelsonii]
MKTSNLKKSTLLVVDDKPENLDVLIAHLDKQGFTLAVALNGEKAIELTKKLSPDLILLDVLMPGINGFETCRRLKTDKISKDIPVIFMTALSETVDKVKGFEAGGVDYITKPFQNEEVLARVNAHLTIREQQKKLEEKNEQLKQEIARREQAEEALQVADAKLSVISEQEAKRWGISGFIGKSQSIKKIIEHIHRLQDVEKTSVLILGESGTGKELIARAIHFSSARAKSPFIPVNCSAIPEELAESAFFGHVRGAFTGAVNNRKGYFESAQGGTLFLDEMGEMPRSLQAKLLRTLEDGTLMPVGSNQEKKVDVRILAATNANLPTKIATGEFRDDLYFRLASYIIHIPPLRERKEDIPLLVDHLLSQFAVEMGRPKAVLTAQALATLENYRFPGNVRELKNLIEHALISRGGAPIQPEHFYFLDTVPVASMPPAPPTSTPPFLPANHEKKIIAYVREHGFINNTQCRALLDLDYHRTSYLLKKMSREGKLVREGERRWSYYRLP